MTRIPTILTACAVGAAALAGAQSERRPFAPEDIHRVREVRELAISPDGDWIAYTLSTTHVDEDERRSDLYLVSWDGDTRVQLTHSEGSESSPRFSPDGKSISFLAARGEDKGAASRTQIHLLARSGGEAVRLTEVPGGVSSYVWSPDGSKIAIVSKDPRDDEGEDDDEKKTPDPIVIDRYQFKRDRVGYLDSRRTRIYVFDVASRETTLVTPGDFDNSEPAWSPDGASLAFTSKREGDPDRHRNSDIYVVDASGGGEPRKVTTWKGPDSSPRFSPDGRQIAYLQGGTPKFSGYDPGQLAIVDLESGQAALPTEEVDRDMRAPRWAPDGSAVFVMVTNDRERYVSRIDASGGELRRRFPREPGVVRACEVGPRGEACIATFPDRPAELYRAEDGAALTDHNRELRESIEWASVEGYDAVSEDGTRVGSMLLKPPGFREGVPYPTVALVHGGPRGQDAHQFDAMAQAIAGAGYVVVRPNYRGSSGRGREFSRPLYADWGKKEIEDIHAVMDQLVADGLADPKRLGIGGWSYGGMNTNYAIATDDRFAAAVSGAAISNVLTGYGTDQYIWQYENEIGLPWEGIETYVRISYPFFHADRIKTPTLFMCGEKDFNVPVINSEQMYQALRSLDVPTRLVVYPGQYHGLSKPSYLQDRIERMIGWYDEYLHAESGGSLFEQGGL